MIFKYTISSLSAGVKVPADEVLSRGAKIVADAGISAHDFFIYRRSVDARKKDNIKFVYAIGFSSECDIGDSQMKKLGLSRIALGGVTPIFGSKKMISRPLIVGAGPAGLFAAYMLAKHGYRPRVIERGGDINSRVAAVENFYSTKILDEDTNIQFGAGGAGTFSDGKLVTRINDDKCAFVLKTFHGFGAPDDILVNAKPHIGTDILRGVISRMCGEIERLGGEIFYNTKLLDIGAGISGVREVLTSRGKMETSSLVLAIGHSARDTYGMLLERGMRLDAKPFSVGLRIEHLKEDIDRALYGDFAGTKELPYAEYALSYNTKNRGVYTFCMCPGGEVVPSCSERDGVVVNGMSRSKRDGRNSNSAVCVSVFTSDFDGTPTGAIEFQRHIERVAFASGGCDFSAPACSVGNFLAGKGGRLPDRILPSYMNGNVTPCDLTKIFPDFITEGLQNGLRDFDKKIHGFASPDAVLTAPETRTSSPVRIVRQGDMTAEFYDDIYPCGEGAGYAGGITSSAVDGIKVALAIMEKYGV